MFATKYEPAWAVQANNVQKLSLFHRENIHFPSNLQTFYFPSIAFESSLPLHALVMSGLLFNFQLDLLIKEKCALPQWCKLTGTEMNIYVMRMMFFCLLTLSVVYRFWLIICVLTHSIRGLQVLIDYLFLAKGVVLESKYSKIFIHIIWA